MGFPYFVEAQGALLTATSYNYYVEWDDTSSIHEPRFIGCCDGTPFRYYHDDPMVALTGVRILVAQSHMGLADGPSFVDLEVGRTDVGRCLVKLAS
jgi:hypothetical protein